MHSRGIKSKSVVTILGSIRFSRTMFRCPACGKTRVPGDEIIDVSETSRSPGLRRMMARAGSSSTFKEGAEDLKVYADIKVSPKDVERVSEGIGEAVETWSKQQDMDLLNENRPVPLRAERNPCFLCQLRWNRCPDDPERGARMEGKTSGWRCEKPVKRNWAVFSLKPRRMRMDIPFGPPPDSTSFVGSIESSDDFGWRIYAEAVRRGMEAARDVVILGDGAEWIWNLADMHFHGPTQIIDLYHARQCASNLCKLLFGSDEKKILRYRKRWWKILDSRKVEKMIAEIRNHLPPNTEDAKQAQTGLNYFENNKKRMRYASFRKRGFFVGSGVIEAGCKNVVGKRFKQSGMGWSVRGANSILALRCSILSNRIDDFWEARVA